MKSPDWAAIEADVLRKLTLLRAAWEHTAETPGLHDAMKRDLYIPALSLLGEFCSRIQEQEEPEEVVQ